MTNISQPIDKPNFATLLAKSKQSQEQREKEERENAPLIASAHPLPSANIILPSQKTKVKHDQTQLEVGKFIRGEINSPPKLDDVNNIGSATTPVDKRVLFTKLFERSKSETVNKKTTPTFSKTGTRDVLFGTGITKKETAKAKTAAKVNFSELFTKAPETNDEVLKRAEQIVDEAPQPPVVSIGIPSDIEWDEYQLKALRALRVNKYMIINGAAGVGKTTVTKQGVKELEASVPTIDLNRARLHKSERPDYNVAICFCAFTGRAVQQMKRPLPVEYHPMCNTVHATLGYAPENTPYQDEKTGEWKEKLVFRPTFTASNKLPYKICVVDEAGMLGIKLWNELLAALPDDARIILIGDINQLPPVQGRSVLGFAMLKWPTYTLEKIHRQAADNPIIANAHNILNGKFPVIDKNRFAMIELPDGGIQAFNHTIGYVQQLHKRGVFDPLRDALIVPQNKGTIGQVHINERLVHYFNPPDMNKRYIITTGLEHVTYAKGDKVMLLQNDRERGLTNGMTGVITDISLNGLFKGERSAHQFTTSFKNVDLTGWENELQGDDDDPDVNEDDVNQRQSSHIVTVRFGGADAGIEIPFSTAGQYRKICLAYAFTCHKSQGGEYPNVIIVAHASNIRMLTREWLYTAVTRAQEKVILLYNDRGLAQAINTQRIKGRTIEEKAKQFLALQDQSDTQLPNLPKPQELTQ